VSSLRSLLHAKQRRIDRISPDGVDVSITPVPVEDTQEHGSEDILCTAAPVADIVERAVLHEFLPASTGLEELEKENELPVLGGGCVLIPFGKKPSARGVQRPRL